MQPHINPNSGRIGNGTPTAVPESEDFVFPIFNSAFGCKFVDPSDLERLRRLDVDPQTIGSSRQLLLFSRWALPGKRDQDSACFQTDETYFQEIVRRFSNARDERSIPKYVPGYTLGHLNQTPSQFYDQVDQAIRDLGGDPSQFIRLWAEYEQTLIRERITRTHLKEMKLIEMLQTHEKLIVAVYRLLRERGYSHKDLEGEPPKPRC